MTAMNNPHPSMSSVAEAPAGLLKMLPPRCYTDQDWFQQEMKAIHYPAWHFVCLASSIAEPGCFITRQFLGRSVIVVRSDDGIIRAFLNTCRHRGAPLTIEACGKNAQSPALFPEKRHLAFPPGTGITGSAAEGTHFCVILPGFFIVTAPEVMWWIQKTPISGKRTSINVGFAFHEETLERADFDEISQFYFERLNRVILEDDQICEYQLRGLENCIQGHYTPMEPVAAYFSNLIATRLQEAGHE